MIQPPKFALSFAGVAFAAVVLTLAAPRAAHAIVAALVQVTNTASNPVIGQSTAEQAAQLVELECVFMSCLSVEPDGKLPLERNGEYYIVPAGQSLIITSVDITTSNSSGGSCTSSTQVNLVTVTGPLPGAKQYVRKAWTVPAGPATSHFSYSSGIVVSGALGLIMLPVGNCAAVTMDLHGYLTAT